MKKGDIIFVLALCLVVLFLINPSTNKIFVEATKLHPYLVGFIKFFVLATMGELLALRIVNQNWTKPQKMCYRALIWGFLGICIVLVFDLFAAGVSSSIAKGLLPGKSSILAFAFFTSTIMNLTFGPVMMGFHRMTDTYLDLVSANKERFNLTTVIKKVDWSNFISFVVLKTIPLFWIPAHTVTFLLPAQYRVLAAAFLSVALGMILAFSNLRGNKSNIANKSGMAQEPNI